jgi:uncharacterized protein (TIGR02594 family)
VSDHLKAVPSWLLWALLETYVKEVPGAKSNPRILEYFRIGKISLTPNDATAWCAIAANASLEANGIPGTQSAGARSFVSSKLFGKLPGPALGALAVWKRGTPDKGLGHVGFYTGEASGSIYVVGGNQGDAFTIAPFPRKSTSMELIGYYWPKGIKLPVIKPIALGASPGFDTVSVV